MLVNPGPPMSVSSPGPAKINVEVLALVDPRTTSSPGPPKMPSPVVDETDPAPALSVSSPSPL